jgi:hypothetical protein
MLSQTMSILIYIETEIQLVEGTWLSSEVKFWGSLQPSEEKQLIFFDIWLHCPYKQDKNIVAIIECSLP